MDEESSAARDISCRDKARFAPEVRESSGVRFSDIAGLDDAKEEIRLRLILPTQYPEKARRYGIRQGGGLLLHGPPGTGKTMLGRAISAELEVPFYYVTPADPMSSQVGQTEKNISFLFQVLRKHDKAVLFLDEVDAIIPKRRRNGSTIMRRAISQFLAESDGLRGSGKDHGIFLVGATNELAMIDAAALRPGRFDTKIYVGLPDARARQQILEHALGTRPGLRGANRDFWVEETAGMTGAEIVGFVNAAADAAFLSEIANDGRQVIDFPGQRPETLVTSEKGRSRIEKRSARARRSLGDGQETG